MPASLRPSHCSLHALPPSHSRLIDLFVCSVHAQRPGTSQHVRAAALSGGARYFTLPPFSSAPVPFPPARSPPPILPSLCLCAPCLLFAVAYATLCPFCAAGKLAGKSGRTYFLDCGGTSACVATGSALAYNLGTASTVGGGGLGLGICCAGLCWASTRDAIVDRFGIEDVRGPPSLCLPCAVLLFALGVALGMRTRCHGNGIAVVWQDLSLCPLLQGCLCSMLSCKLWYRSSLSIYSVYGWLSLSL